MMRTYRGIVCEKKTKYMVFLTKEGEFLRGIPIGSNPEIGEEAEFQLFKATTANKIWIKPSVFAPVLVAAVFLLFVIASFIPNPNTALAYVQLDGKNAVELGVNKNGQVVTLRSFNERAPINLKDWEGHPIDFVLAKAVNQMSPITEKLAITTVYENKKLSADMRQLIEVAVEEVQNEHNEKVLIIKESTPEERKEANKQNTSIQKLKHANEERKKDDHKGKENDHTDIEEQPSPPKEPHSINKNLDEKTSNEKELKQQEKLIEQQEKQKEKEIEKQQKEIEKQQEKLEKAKEKEAKEQEKVREKEAKEQDKAREKEEKEKAEEEKKQQKEKQKEQQKEQDKNEENEEDED